MLNVKYLCASGGVMTMGSLPAGRSWGSGTWQQKTQIDKKKQDTVSQVFIQMKVDLTVDELMALSGSGRLQNNASEQQTYRKISVLETPSHKDPF